MTFPVELSDEEWRQRLDQDRFAVLREAATEPPFTGALLHVDGEGTFACGGCGQVLFTTTQKFDSGCGWPSFDDEIKGAVRKSRDADGYRVEITCENCGGHLGHVFYGEGMTAKNTRHCVNSVSMKFVAEGEKLPAVVKKKSRSRSSARKEADAPADKAADKSTDK